MAAGDRNNMKNGTPKSLHVHWWGGLNQRPVCDGANRFEVAAPLRITVCLKSVILARTPLFFSSLLSAFLKISMATKQRICNKNRLCCHGESVVLIACMLPSIFLKMWRPRGVEEEEGLGMRDTIRSTHTRRVIFHTLDANVSGGIGIP